MIHRAAYLSWGDNHQSFGVFTIVCYYATLWEVECLASQDELLPLHHIEKYQDINLHVRERCFCNWAILLKFFFFRERWYYNLMIFFFFMSVGACPCPCHAHPLCTPQFEGICRCCWIYRLPACDLEQYVPLQKTAFESRQELVVLPEMRSTLRVLSGKKHKVIKL